MIPSLTAHNKILEIVAKREDPRNLIEIQKDNEIPFPLKGEELHQALTELQEAGLISENAYPYSTSSALPNHWAKVWITAQGLAQLDWWPRKGEEHEATLQNTEFWDQAIAQLTQIQDEAAAADGCNIFQPGGSADTEELRKELIVRCLLESGYIRARQQKGFYAEVSLTKHGKVVLDITTKS